MHQKMKSILLIFPVLLLNASLFAQENASENDPVDPLKIKVSVKEVRLDIVVLDKDGNPVTDLTAEHFEVYQDGKQQEILSSVYIDSQLDTYGQPLLLPDNERKNQNLPHFRTPALKRENVGRTIVFLVDDYSMRFEDSYYAKMALRNFVEKQMLPGDLVAIIRTGYGNSALNMFYSDKSELLARINALPATMAVHLDDYGAEMALFAGNSVFQRAASHAYGEFRERALINLMENISYSIRAVNGLPGRKIINTITPQLMVNINLLYEDPTRGDLMKNMKKLSDEAMRAGVVINFLGIEGLRNFPGFGADASNPLKGAPGGVVGGPLQPANSLASKYWEAASFLDPFNPLPDMTGGVLIRNRNFFLDGIGKETESLMRGYYLISYAPPPGTFEKGGKNDDMYRRLKVRVKRNGATVHMRDGFFARIESESKDNAPDNPLIAAIYSPFQSTDLNVNIAAGYVKDAKAGYLVRTWIHIDPKDVKVVETEDGGNRIDLEAVILTSGINGAIQDSKGVEFSISNINTDWIRKHGIRFSMLLPVKKPGSYYVRIAVKDKESDKVGSAYQFLEIPDTGKKGKALSNIFMITSADDLNWLRSDVKNEIGKGVFFPMVQGEDVRSPALRTYKPGDNLMTVVMLYNADEKAIARSEIETQTILYKDGKEFLRGAPAAITPDKVDNPDSIMLVNRFVINSAMTPGDYILQILASDKKNRGNEGAASSQFLGFTVIEP